MQSLVLPKIKELAKRYGRNIDLCDLRWGVNSAGISEEESTAKVLQVCFDEIDKSRPFFIAILGDCYGWVPDAAIVENSTSWSMRKKQLPCWKKYCHQGPTSRLKLI